MKFKNTIFSVMVATCLPNLALADDNKSFNLKLDEITVTATKTPIKIEEVPIATTYAFDSNLQEELQQEEELIVSIIYLAYMPIKRVNLKLKTARPPTINPKDKIYIHNLIMILWINIHSHQITLTINQNISQVAQVNITHYLDNYYHKIWDANPVFYTSANLSYNGEFGDLFSLYITSGTGENNFDYTYGYKMALIILI